MASDDSALFSRQALLDGLSARGATTLLFAIENRTAQLAARAARAVPIVLSERAAQQQERAFLEALAQGRDRRAQPGIRDLERFAPDWADLVPDDAGQRAGVAHLLGSKHAFAAADVPDLRRALGLDTEAVQHAYTRLHGQPLGSIYASRVRPWERLQWAASKLSSRLDRLPAFWLAFVVTLIIGAVNLALPIAVAGVGALPGVALIVALGLVNLVTIVAMVEVVTRSGSIRHGQAFIGTVVGDYLGGAASAILSAVLTAFSFGILLIFYVGISTTLEDATGLAAPIWMIGLFLVGLYFLTRGSLNATVASTIVITTINVALLLALTALAFTHLRPENLGYVNLPWIGGGSFEPIVLGALVGVVLDIYAAHILVAIFGRTLLERDPSGRSVVRGHAAGIGFAMVLNVAWVLAVSGAIAPAVLAGESSTALVPLAAELGPEVRVLGAVFVILSMGLGLIQFSLALFHLAGERIGPQFAWAGGRGRFLLALAPVLLVLVVAEWMVLTESGSFAGILGFLGVMVHSLMSGIFPVLLLLASRRKGELVPGVSYRALGHPLLVGSVFVLALSNVVLHGLLIWEHPLQRLGGVGIGLLMLGVTAAMIRRGAFRPRAVVELREDRRRDAPSLLTLTADGRALDGAVEVTSAGGRRRHHDPAAPLADVGEVRSVAMAFDAGRARELKVWAHAISPEGVSEALPVRATVDAGGVPPVTLDLAAAGGQAVMRLAGPDVRIELLIGSTVMSESPARVAPAPGAAPAGAPAETG